MTVVRETPHSTIDVQEELVGSLEQLLHGYIALLGSSSHGGQWSQDETALVRQTRDLLVRSGHTPKLTYDVINHIDSPMANPPLTATAL